MIYQLVYVSDICITPYQKELNTIFTKTIANNEIYQISGFLAYRGGNFLQLLEGDKLKVLALYDVIKSDNRHKNLTIISEGQVQNRAFNDYAGGFLTPLNSNIFDKLESYLTFLRLLENPKLNETVSAVEAILSKM